MPAPHIRSEYDQLKNIQGQFNSQADAILQTSNQLKSCIDKLKGGDWICEGARKFYEEMDNQILPAVARLQDALTTGGNTSEAIAKAIKKAEDDSALVIRFEFS